MEHVAPRHVGPEQLLQEEVCEDVAVLVLVVLEPEIERQPGGEPHLGPGRHAGHHLLPPEHGRGHNNEGYDVIM